MIRRLPVFCLLLLALTAVGDSARGVFGGGNVKTGKAEGFRYSQWLRGHNFAAGDDNPAQTGHNFAARDFVKDEAGGHNDFWHSLNSLGGKFGDGAVLALRGLPPDDDDAKAALRVFVNGGNINFAQWRRARLDNALARLDNDAAAIVASALEDEFGALPSIKRIGVQWNSAFGEQRKHLAFDAIGGWHLSSVNVAGWQGRFYGDGKATRGGNFGLFARSARGGNLFGINLFADYQKERDISFWRMSFGGEWRAKLGAASINRYWQLGGDKRLPDNFIAYTKEGADARLLIHLPGAEWLSLAGDYYHWRGRYGESDDEGFRYGLRFRPGGGWRAGIYYDDDNRWSADISYEAIIGEGDLLAADGIDTFDARIHFWDAVRREYGQRIFRVSIRAEGERESGGEESEREEEDNNNRFADAMILAADAGLGFRVASPGGTMTIAGFGAVLSVYQTTPPTAHARATLLLTTSPIMALSSGGGEGSVIVRGHRADWQLSLPQDTRLAFGGLAKITIMDGGGAFIRASSNISPSLFALSSSISFLTLGIDGASSRFAFRSGARAFMTLSHGALSLWLPPSATLALTADIGPQDASLRVFGATSALVACGAVITLWDIRARCPVVISPLSIGIVMARTIIVIGAWQMAALVSASGGHLIDGGDYRYSILIPEDGGINIVNDGAVSISSSNAGLITATIIADDGYVNTQPATVMITVHAVDGLILGFDRTQETITAHLARVIALATLRGIGGLPGYDYALDNIGQGVSLSNRIIIASLSIAAQSPVMTSALTATAIITDAAKATASIIITLSVQVINPPSLTISAALANSIILTGNLQAIATISASGGYLIEGGDYRYSALAADGADIIVASDGAVSISIANAGLITATIMADDEHINTAPATILITVRAVDGLVLGFDRTQETITAHLARVINLATLRGVGGLPGYDYALDNSRQGVSLSNRIIIASLSIAAQSPVMTSALTATAIITDAAKATASIIITLSVQVINPPSLTITAALANSIILTGNLQAIATISASGGYLIEGGDYRYSALAAEGADIIVASDGAVSISIASAGLITATIMADDEHINTAPATILITARAVDGLVLGFDRTEETITAHLARVINLATLQGVGGLPGYDYALDNIRQGVSLSNRIIIASLSIAAQSPVMTSALTATAIIADAAKATASIVITLSVRVINPPSITITAALANSIILTGNLQAIATISASGGYLIEGGDYRYSALAADGADIIVASDGAVSISTANAGLITATIMADDYHINTQPATILITARAVDGLILGFDRTQETITAHLARIIALATLQGVGGLPGYDYALDNTRQGVSLSSRIIVASLSIAAQSPVMTSALTATAIITDAAKATASIIITLSVQVINPPPLTISAALANSIILTGTLQPIATISASGGYLIDGGDYRYSALAADGADIIVASDGAISISIANAGLITATIMADDYHINTQPATILITARAVDGLVLGFDRAEETITAHLSRVINLATLRGIGGLLDYDYALDNIGQGVSLSNRIIVASLSIAAQSPVITSALTATAIITDAANATASIIITLSVQVINPPSLTISAALANSIILTGNLQPIATISASGGYLIDGGDYRYSALAADGADIIVANDGAVSISIANAGLITATIMADDEHINTAPATILITARAVDGLVLGFDRTEETITAHIANTINLATLRGVGGLPGYDYALDNTRQGVSLSNRIIVASLSIAAQSPVMTSALTATAIITDAAKATSSIIITLSVRVINPPSITITAALANSIILTGDLQLIATISASGGYVIDDGDYRYSALAASGADIIVASDGAISISIANAGLITATIMADDEHINTAPATILITARAVDGLILGFDRTEETITAHLSRVIALATLQAVGGLPGYDYALDNSRQGVSLSNRIIVASLSIAAQSPVMTSALTATAIITDAAKATASIVITLSVQVINPPPLSITAALANSIILTGDLQAIATISASGGYLIDDGDYRYSALAAEGADIIVASDGAVSISIAHAGLITATIMADDEHINTAPATILITARAVDGLILGFDRAEETITAHLSRTINLATLQGVGGLPGYDYALDNIGQGVSLSNRIIVASLSIAAQSPVITSALTATAIITDAAKATASIVITLSVQVINPPSLTITAVLANSIILTGDLQPIATISASGGYLIDGGDYRYSALAADGADIIVAEDGAISISIANAGLITATIMADDEHINTAPATILITARAVDGLILGFDRTRETITAHLARVIALATLQGVGGLPGYDYALDNSRQGVSLSNRIIVASLSIAAQSPVMTSALTATAIIADAAKATASIIITLSVQVINPPSLTITAALANSIILTGNLQAIATISASGGYLIDGGDYRYSALAADGADIIVASDGAVSISIASAGLITATIMADDEHVNTKPATILITARAVDGLVLGFDRVQETITAHLARVIALATLQGVGGLPGYDYALDNSRQGVSLSNRVIIASLSIAAQSPVMTSALTATAIITDAAKATASIIITLSVQVINPPSLTITAALANSIILTGNLQAIATISASGGYVINGGDYRYSALAASGADIIVADNGAISISIANAGLITATIMADDEHINTAPATILITTRAVDSLILGFDRTRETITAHLARVIALATLRGIGGLPGYDYLLDNPLQGVSLSNRIIIASLSIAAQSPVMTSALTATAIITDAAKATASIIITLSVKVVNPPPLSITAALANSIILTGKLQAIATISASGGYLIDDGDYRYSALAASGADIIVANDGAVSIVIANAGLITATIMADDYHINTQPATILITARAVDGLVLGFDRTQETITAHLAKVIALATLQGVGGLPGYDYALDNSRQGVSLSNRIIIASLSIAAQSPVMTSALTATAIITDAANATASIVITLSVQVINPPSLTITAALANSIVLTGNLQAIATISASGGYLIDDGDYRYSALAAEGADIIVASDGAVSISIAHAGLITATIMADDEHINTAPATILITARAVDGLVLGFDRTQETITAHLARVINLATLQGVGGLPGYDYALDGNVQGVSLSNRIIVASLSIAAQSPVMTSALTATAIITDAAKATASIIITLSVRVINPPSLTITAVLANSIILTGNLQAIATISASGGYVINGGDYRYSALALAEGDIIIADNGAVSISIANAGLITATIMADDEHINTAPATILITTRATADLVLGAAVASVTLSYFTNANATLATLRASGGLAALREYALPRADDGISITGGSIVMLSAFVADASVYAFDAAVVDTLPGVVSLSVTASFSLTAVLVGAGRIRANIVGNIASATALLDNRRQFIASLSISGGDAGEGYRFSVLHALPSDSSTDDFIMTDTNALLPIINISGSVLSGIASDAFYRRGFVAITFMVDDNNDAIPAAVVSLTAAVIATIATDTSGITAIFPAGRDGIVGTALFYDAQGTLSVFASEGFTLSALREGGIQLSPGQIYYPNVAAADAPDGMFAVYATLSATGVLITGTLVGGYSHGPHISATALFTISIRGLFGVKARDGMTITTYLTGAVASLDTDNKVGAVSLELLGDSAASLSGNVLFMTATSAGMHLITITIRAEDNATPSQITASALTISFYAIDPPPVVIGRDGGQRFTIVLDRQTEVKISSGISASGGYLYADSVYDLSLDYDAPIGGDVVVSMSLADSGKLYIRGRDAAVVIITAFADDDHVNTERASVVLTAVYQRGIGAFAGVRGYTPQNAIGVIGHNLVTVRAGYPFLEEEYAEATRYDETFGGGVVMEVGFYGAFGRPDYTLTAGDLLVRHVSWRDNRIYATVANADSDAPMLAGRQWLNQFGLPELDVMYVNLRLRTATMAARMTATLIVADKKDSGYVPATVIVEVTINRKMKISASVASADITQSSSENELTLAVLGGESDDMPVIYDIIGGSPAVYVNGSEVRYVPALAEAKGQMKHLVTVTIVGVDSYRYFNIANDFSVHAQSAVLTLTATVVPALRIPFGAFHTVFNPGYNGTVGVLSLLAGHLRPGDNYAVSVQGEGFSIRHGTLYFRADEESVYIATIIASDSATSATTRVTVHSAICNFFRGIGCPALGWAGRSYPSLTARMVSLILRSGADPNAADEELPTKPRPLGLMMRGRAPQNAMAVLLAAGADINGADANGRTALSYAAGRGPVIIRFMLDNGATRAADNFGNLPSHWIALEDMGTLSEITELLMNLSASERQDIIRQQNTSDTVISGRVIDELYYRSTPLDAALYAAKGGNSIFDGNISVRKEEIIDYFRDNNGEEGACNVQCENGEVAIGVADKLLATVVNISVTTSRDLTSPVTVALGFSGTIANITASGGAFTRNYDRAGRLHPLMRAWLADPAFELHGVGDDLVLRVKPGMRFGDARRATTTLHYEFFDHRPQSDSDFIRITIIAVQCRFFAPYCPAFGHVVNNFFSGLFHGPNNMMTMLQAGIDPNEEDSRGFRILHRAYNSPFAASVLIEAGADVNALARVETAFGNALHIYGSTPLDVARRINDNNARQRAGAVAGLLEENGGRCNTYCRPGDININGDVVAAVLTNPRIAEPAGTLFIRQRDGDDARFYNVGRVIADGGGFNTQFASGQGGDFGFFNVPPPRSSVYASNRAGKDSRTLFVLVDDRNPNIRQAFLYITVRMLDSGCRYFAPNDCGAALAGVWAGDTESGANNPPAGLLWQLVNGGLDVNARSDANQYTPLHAVRSPVLGSILLEGRPPVQVNDEHHRADVNAKTSYGQTKILQLMEQRLRLGLNNADTERAGEILAFAGMLVSVYNADLSAADNCGQTPLHLVIQHPGLAAMFIRHGAPVNAQAQGRQQQPCTNFIIARKNETPLDVVNRYNLAGTPVVASVIAANGGRCFVECRIGNVHLNGKTIIMQTAVLSSRGGAPDNVFVTGFLGTVGTIGVNNTAGFSVYAEPAANFVIDGGLVRFTSAIVQTITARFVISSTAPEVMPAATLSMLITAAASCSFVRESEDNPGGCPALQYQGEDYLGIKVITDAPPDAGLLMRIAAAGADPDVFGRLEGQPEGDAENNLLRAAIEYNHPVLASILIGAGANVHLTETPEDLPPLHLAAAYGNARMAAMIVDAGANVNLSNPHDGEPVGRWWSPMDVAVYYSERDGDYLRHWSDYDATIRLLRVRGGRCFFYCGAW